jgi:hypothetical protein
MQAAAPLHISTKERIDIFYSRCVNDVVDCVGAQQSSAFLRSVSPRLPQIITPALVQGGGFRLQKRQRCASPLKTMAAAA